MSDAQTPAAEPPKKKPVPNADQGPPKKPWTVTWDDAELKGHGGEAEHWNKETAHSVAEELLEDGNKNVTIINPDGSHHKVGAHHEKAAPKAKRTKKPKVE